MKKQVMLITQSFPYKPGEEFLETEIKYFQKHKGLQLIIMPLHSNTEIRNIDDEIKVDNYLINNQYVGEANKYFSLIKNIFSTYFYKEMKKNGIYSFEKIKVFNASLNYYKYYYNLFDVYFAKRDDCKKTIIYTYWNTEITYALQSLKNKYGYKLISRIHGYDLYQERRAFDYMPLKKQFTKNIDKVYTITKSANDYLHKTYGFDWAVLELSRLGVDDHQIISKPTDSNVLHIVSCSFITTVKRIDKIIDALKILSNTQPRIQYIWTHIGNGDLYQNILKKAKNDLEPLKNISYEFKGNLDNQKVYQFYKDNKIDLFINVSESEGVPVSIMEAMSCHIPIVAPDIGGISDIVLNGYNGILLSEKCDVNEIVIALNKKEYFHNERIRTNSYKVFLDNYNSKKNYQLFIENLKLLTFK